LLAAGAKHACAADQHGNTVLIRPLQRRHEHCKDAVGHALQYLSDQRCGETALPFAALFRRVDMIPVLVAHDANANHVDACGGTAVQAAIAQRNTAAADAPRQAGATE
jgi:uncharacterized protein